MDYKITIPTWLQDLLKKIAERTLPEECCGLLYGQTLTYDVKEGEGEPRIHFMVRDLLTAPNEAKNKEKDFSISPAHVPILETVIEAKGMEVVGIYHSHPRTTLIPSEGDERFNSNPGIPMIICNTKDVKAFLILKEGGELEEITITN